MLLPPSPEHKAKEEVKEQLAHRTALVRIWDLCPTCVTDIQGKSFSFMEGHEETLADTSQISSLGTSDIKTILPGAHAVPLLQPAAFSNSFHSLCSPFLLWTTPSNGLLRQNGF